jgi:hypothetical protein
MKPGIGKLRNRQLAHAVLAAFAAGFLGLPCLHQLAHQRPHQHGADGFSVRWLDAAADGAGDAAHAWAHRQGQAHAHGAEAPPEAPEVPPSGALSTPSPAPHGAGGASHFAVGLVAPPVYLLPPPAAEAVVLSLTGPAAEPPARFSYAVARPRGPPA